MSLSETFKSKKPISREKKALNPKPHVLDNDDTLIAKTPEKSQQPPRRARNRNVALSIGDVRRAAAKSLSESIQKQRTDQIGSARRKIAAWVDESPKRTSAGASEKLPEKYEILVEFFNCLDSSIRLLRLRGMKQSFTNICLQIESLTDRRFTRSHLAQLKFILPEVIEIKDERTSCMKPDLHVTMNVDAVENDGKSKSDGGGIMHLRRAFCKRLIDISKCHPEDYEIPEETLPHPFNCAKLDMHPDTIKFPSSLSSGEVLSDPHTVEQPETSTTCLQGDGTQDVTHPMPAIAAQLPRSFRRHFSKTSFQAPNLLGPESNLSTVCSIDESSTAASSNGQVPATPTKEIDPLENEYGLPRKSASNQSTPAKAASTPAGLMTGTPALRPPKRSYMSPDDNSSSSPNKLVRRPPRSRSLKFDTPVKNKKVEDEVLDLDGGPIDDDILDILPEDLLQSLRDKERKTMEERDPAISQAKKRRRIIACLPKLFNMIHFLFQSMNRSVISKEELVYKIISSHCDIVDRGEVEEQLNLLLELVPEWISEKELPSGADLPLIHINKMSHPESIRAKLEEAKRAGEC